VIHHSHIHHSSIPHIPSSPYLVKMKILLHILSLLPLTVCSQINLSPYVDTSNVVHREIVERLDEFLLTKDTLRDVRKYWMASDFEKYPYPYLDLFRIEYKGKQANFYRPELLKIMETEDSSTFLLKIAFVGYDEEKQQASLKSVYSMMAHLDGEEVKFSRAINHYLKDWQKEVHYPITYYISPQREANEEEIKRQLKDIKMLDDFFETDSIAFSYYSCVDPVELFRLKGFDYNAGMYFDTKGGIIEYGNHLFSGNNSEHYSHEVAHIYVNTLFPRTLPLLNEGIATYLAGANQYAYAWHKENLKKYIESQDDFSFTNYLQAYEKVYANEETAIPYMTGALICEYILEKEGKEKLFEIMKARQPLWDALETVGLNEGNLNAELVETLKL